MVSNVEIPNLEVVLNPEATLKVKEDTNNSPSRMVKFDMASFDSQTSEVLPSITIDLYDVHESDVEENLQNENAPLFCDKSTETETLADGVDICDSTEEGTYNIYEEIWSHIKINELDKDAVIATVKDVFGILADLNTEKNGDEANSTAIGLGSDRNTYLAKLRNAIVCSININKTIIAKGHEPRECQGVVQTHTLILENIEPSLLNNLKDQHGCQIKQLETQAKQTNEFESKVETVEIPSNQNDYYNIKTSKKFSSCPELLRAGLAKYSDEAFAQAFGQQCEEDAEDFERNEDKLCLDVHSSDGSDDSLKLDMDIIRNCLFTRETQIVDDFVML